MKYKGHFPFSPLKIPFFYGWIILFAGTIGVIMSIPGQTAGVSAFTEHLLADLSINRDNLSLAYLAGTLVSGLIITRAGKLYDKYGARIISLSSGILLGVMLLYLTRIEVLVEFMDNHNLLSPELATFLFLALGFLGIRFFGQGMLTMASRNMVMKWFDKRRGMANAVLGIVTAFGFSLAPKILSNVVEELQWKGAWALLALLVGVVFSVFVVIFFRDNPEACGLKADGSMKVKGKGKRPPSLPARDSTLKEAKKTLAFWAFTLGLALSAMYATGLTFHVVSIFESSGMDKNTALSIFLPASLIAMVVQFGGSYLSDFIRLKYLLLTFMFGMIITSFGMSFLSGARVFYFMLIGGYGIGWGFYSVLIGVTWPRFYGLKHLGAISGYSLSWTVFGSALGPYFFSLSRNHLGSYAWAALLCMAIAIVLFLIGLKADNPAAKE